jgi:hypothetical protein
MKKSTVNLLRHVSGLLLVAIVAVALSLRFDDFSVFSLNFALAALALALLFYADKFLLPGFDLVTELKQKNVAVAIAFFGLCYLLASCFGGAK